MIEAVRAARGERISMLRSIDLGAPVAEQDSLLYEARVETGAFTDLFRDRVDLVPGTKGSGKTALYRLISEYVKHLMLKTRVVLITGVEAAGDPVFLAFKSRFEKLSEMEFENFWRVYFVALISDKFLKSREYREFLVGADSYVKGVEEKCKSAKIPTAQRPRGFRQIVEAVLRRVKLRIGTASQSTEGFDYSLVEVEPAANDAPAATSVSDAPVFLNEIHDAIVRLLINADVKIWILLDRLDEVFPRRTPLERTALRSLLRATRNFPTERVRIKIFLRDDILENVVLGSEGFTALSHIEARCATTLKWGAKEINLLIVKRFAANHRVRRLCAIAKSRIDDNDMEHAEEVFYRIFPSQVISGKNQSRTSEWIYHHCEDGRGVVTPRDVIDLLEFAVKAQIAYLQRGGHPEPDCLIGAQALKDALGELSKKKCRTYLEAEFPQFWPEIRKFEHAKAEHNSQSLQKLLGKGWHEKVDDLMAIGFLQKRPQSKSFIIPFVFRPGLAVRQGKAF
jgi:hypothetical protein